MGAEENDNVTSLTDRIVERIWDDYQERVDAFIDAQTPQESLELANGLVGDRLADLESQFDDASLSADECRRLAREALDTVHLAAKFIELCWARLQ